MFWLSHHPPEELHRTYRFGGLAVCARCLGTYPVMFAFIAGQVAMRAPLEWRWDGPWALGLLLPATLDWGVGRLRPALGSNGWRTVTGVLLGLALGRTLYVHLLRPFPPWLLAQATVVTAVVLFVIVLRLARRGA